MPPKQPFDIKSELRKQQKAEEKKKKKQQIIKEKPRKELFTPRMKDVKKKQAEEELRRNFFFALIDTDDEEVQSKLTTFGNQPNALWGRKQFVDTILFQLPEVLIKTFAYEYTNQDNQSSENFYKNFVQRPNISIAIRKNKERIDKEEDEEAKFARELDKEMLKEKRKKEEKRKLEKQLFGDDYSSSDDEEEDISQSLPPSKKRYKGIKIIDKEGRVLSPPVQTRKRHTLEPYINPCTRLYKDSPWVDASVEGVFLLSADDGDISSYVFTNIVEQHDWNKANNKFFKLLCSNVTRTQKGNVMTVRKGMEVIMRVMVGYKTPRGFIVQNEEVFQAEKDYIKRQKRMIQERLVDILNESVTNDVEKLGATKLSECLLAVADNVDYHKDSTYIFKAIETASSVSRKIGDFARKIGDVCVYLGGDMSGLSHEIFTKRIKGEYYLPEILMSLTPSEKLPEIYDDPRVTEDKQRKADNIIDQKLNRFVQEFAEGIYELRHPTDRRPSKLQKWPVRHTIELGGSWKSACLNSAQVVDIPDENLVYYKENDKVYCLIIDEIRNRIDNGNFENPYTGENLSEEFILRFQDLYDLELSQKGYKRVPPPLELKSVDPIILAPGLLGIIQTDIKELEDELMYEKGGSDEEKGDSDEEKGGSDDEKVIEEKEESRRGTEPLSDEEVCKYCNERFPDPEKALKSMMDTGDKHGAKVVKLCSFKCFEKYDNWPKKRSKKSSPKQKRKKGKK